MSITKGLISVVTVVYNAASVIEDTIKSILDQTYSDIEYIIIDGGSTDGTIDIIKKYESSIKYWVSEPDKGIYDAMNKGIDQASGEWINFMNAGDYFFSSDVIFQLFGTSEDYSPYAVVYGDADFRLKNLSYVIEALDSNSDRFMPFSHQAAFSRTELAKQNKFNLKYKIAADTEFFLRLIRSGLIFKHQSVVVCSYDALDGMSIHNEVRRSKELVAMQLEYGATYNEYYKKFIRDARIKQFIRKVIPNSIWVKMRENKIRKEKGLK